MAVAFSSIVNVTPATGAGPVTTPAITMAASLPAAVIAVILRDATATVSGTPTTTFGGTVTEIISFRAGSGGFECLVSLWGVTAPTAAASGTASITLTASVPYLMAVLAYSGANQTTPFPLGDVQTSSSSVSPQTVTPTNLVTGDVSMGAIAMATGTMNPCTPNDRYRDNATTVKGAMGDATDTTGVTFDDGNNGVGRPIAVLRIAQPPAGPPGGSFVQQILRSRMREW